MTGPGRFKGDTMKKMRGSGLVWLLLVLVVVALLVGIAASTAMYLRAESARQAAKSEALAAEANQRRLADEREASMVAQAKFEALNDFLKEMLSSVDPEEGREVKIVDILDRAAKDLEATAADQPEMQASLRSTIGQAYLDLGMYEKAEVLLLKAHSTFGKTLGENHPRTQEAARRVASLYTAWGRPDQAKEYQDLPESPEKE